MKKYLVLLILAIFAVPLSAFIHIRGSTVWYSQYVMLKVLLFAGLASVLWKFNKYITLFLICCVVSWAYTAHTNPRAMLLLIQIFLCMLASYGISMIPYRTAIFKAILGLVILQGIYVIVQYFNLDPFFNHINDASLDDTVGFAGSHNQIGNFFAITSPIVISYAGLLLPLVIFGLFNSTTSTAWVAFVISGWLCLAFKKHQYITVFVIMVLFASIGFYKYFENMNSIVVNERVELVKLSIRQVEEENAILYDRPNNRAKKVICNKWFGYGLGNFIAVSPLTQYEFIYRDNIEDIRQQPQHVYSHAHNDFIEVYFEMGRIGFILLLLIALNLIYRFVTSQKTRILKVSFCCLVAHGICALGVFTVHTATTGMLLPIMLGIFEGEYRRLKIKKMAKVVNYG